ncbi:MAG TPA: glycosyl transferase family 36, partial [Polyangia bacterium]
LRMDGDIETRTEIVVSPEDSAEVRRVTVMNHGDETREIELTSYGEIVMAPPEADRAHPAFGNLFVETEWHEWCTAITATRRPRSPKDRALWCLHVVDTGKERVGNVTCETDRGRFIGRGRSLRDPLAMEGELLGTTGAVLDPIFALRTRVRLKPKQSANVAFTTLVATSRERVFALADRYHDPHTAQRALDLAWTSTQVELRELAVTPRDAGVFQALAGLLFFASSGMRSTEEELGRNRGSQPLLWAHGISGDWPILLAMVESSSGLPTLRQLFAAHHYWRRRGMMVDLVILNKQPSTYLQPLNEAIASAMFEAGDLGVADQPGGVFVRSLDLLSADELLMLRATARVHITCDGQSLARMMEGVAAGRELAPDEDVMTTAPRPPERSGVGNREHRSFGTPHGGVQVFEPAAEARPPAPPPMKRLHESEKAPLLFDNGTGGMTTTGAYQIRVRGDALPPAPWANVIANPQGGFVVTERGGGFTWAENSFFFRITPWYNDPVTDPPGDVLFIRDEVTKDVWTATPALAPRTDAFTVVHAPGSSTFEHEHDGIVTHLTMGLVKDEAIKVSVLRITNRGTQPRRLTVTAYVEWTLAVLREHAQHQVLTSYEPEHAAIFARNFFDPAFASRVAFCASSAPVSSHTGDRRAFIGRNGTLASPAGLRRPKLDGATGAAVDPCAALQIPVTLAPGESHELSILLGATPDEASARRALSAYRAVDAAKAAVAHTVASWSDRLSVIKVRTPDPAFDAMLNQWALYQALSCRIWARSALYQSSGAFGFRDQLQDVMALVYAEPALARAHILVTTSRQFVEGDVQHWWHPQSGRGVRTRFSDDLAWLPFVVDQYIRVTGDASVLDEQVPFLAMRTLGAEEHEIYDLPAVADEKASVYEHCMRALRRATTAGVHGLPLIGIGDWNDGMSRVGVEGRGESVWLAWFLAKTMRDFALRAEARGDVTAAGELRASSEKYVAAVEAHGWDGAWYRRAYFDDGAPMGSATSDECRIDAIAQSWSVISGAAAPARQAQAMKSLEENLINEDARLLMLLTPPFDKTTHDPGYIKGYLPGVRENGAQYTHAALWTVLATAMRGDGDRAFELFQMINPLTHALTPADVQIYKVEPYVVAADVYTARGQLGRGGWTWYTGSASWLYRVGLESILGFTRTGNMLAVAPCVPKSWPGFTIEYRFGKSQYVITVDTTAGGESQILVDGRPAPGGQIALVDDAARHEVVVRTGG